GGEMRSFTLGVLGLAVPLAMIALSIAVSPWFSVVDDALSDLGHAAESRAAPLFNLGLSTGGVLMFAAAVVMGAARVYRVLVGAAGYFLVLIGVFDETYGRLHFYVSVAFFASVILLLAIYGAREKRPAYPALAAAAVAAWYMHFALNTPPGAAIPELVSIAVAIPPYVSLIRERGEAGSVGR
ncbi:MAG: DUF998 domain-containing protein, partial [Candidatus Korarchaeota archaeon]|nr:DUF998 domain-containing protein [Candidatus Korarchaeota archaeon]